MGADASASLQQAVEPTDRPLEGKGTKRHLTVVPVVDYELPPVGASSCPVPSPTALRRPTTRRARLRAVPSTSPVSDPPWARAAAAFADAVSRSVLEVVDRRRPLAQLQPMMGEAVLDTVLTLAGEARTGSSAVLRRVRLRIVDRDGEAAEVFGTYARGKRVHAIAGRVERVSIRGTLRWRLVALQIG